MKELKEKIECIAIINTIKTGILFFILIFLIVIMSNIKEKEREYKVLCETKQEIIITDGEDIITIEKEETEGENEE